MAYGSALTIIIIEDLIVFAIIILVVAISCYNLIRRCIIDYKHILILTSNNVVVPVEQLNNRHPVSTIGIEIPSVPDLPNS